METPIADAYLSTAWLMIPTVRIEVNMAHVFHKRQASLLQIDVYIVAQILTSITLLHQDLFKTILINLT